MKRAIILLAIALAGCAGAPERRDEPASTRAGRAAAEKLYAGQPAIVHATEFPVASAAEGMARGDEAWRRGQLDLAVYLYVQSLAYGAESPEPFLRIAAIHEKLGNRALAEKAFELALEREPANAGANERLGLLYLEDRNDVAAEPRLQRAIELDDARWQAHNGLGIIADRRGEFAAAERHYDRAHALRPGDAAVINNRGYSRYLAGNFVAAEADLRYAVALGPQPGTWSNLGRALARQSRFDEALECLLEETDQASAYNVLGEVALDGGDLDKARHYFDQAISAAPRYFPTARENLEQVNARLAAASANAIPADRAGANATGAAATPYDLWLYQPQLRAAARKAARPPGAKPAGDRRVK